MLKNYFLIAIRNLWRHKLHTTINVIGLAIGISACLTIFLLVNYEYSFDTFHPDKERIYRVYTKYSGLFDATNSGIAFPVPAAIRKECTGVEAIGHFMTLNNLDITIENQNQPRKRFEEQNQVIAAEPDFFKVFKSYKWLEGTPESALSEPFKVVLTESRAKFYFGNIQPTNAIGREIAYNDSLRVTVSGIVADLKKQTDFTFTDFISFASIPQSWLKNHIGGAEGLKDWGSTTSASQVFIKLEKDVPTSRMIKQFDKLIAANQKDKDSKLKLEYKLEPLADLRFSTIGIFNDSRAAAHRPTLNALLLVAGLLLVIAAINFVNLATAQAVQRSKEVGVRKVLGGTRGVLVLQFLGETLMVTIVAVLFSILLTDLAIRFFHEFLPEGLNFNPLEPIMLFFIVTITLVVALLAGLYPAFVLSAFKPVVALKNQFFTKGTGSGAEWLRKGLIVFQFTFSLALIAGTIIIGRQIHFMQDQDMGFNMDAVVHFNLPYQQPSEKKAVLKTKLEQLASIKGVSLHAAAPASNNVNTTIYRFNNGKEIKDYEFHVKSADTSYIHLYDILLLAGRNLLPADSTREFLINETALHSLGFKNPQEALDKVIITDEKKGTGFPIVGVVKDFHSRSLHEPIHPLVIVTNPYRYDISAKLATQGRGAAAFKQTLAQVTNAWKEVYPNDKFEYTFVKEDIAKFYENEQRMSKLMRTATGIAIFISCIGLFGLVSFTVARRTKEIGIRKILGASITHIVTLLSKDLLVLVLIAILLGSPIAWYFTNKWLADFAYRIDIQWWMFALAGAAAVGVALLTISLQAIRAAVANPVESLKSE